MSTFMGGYGWFDPSVWKDFADKTNKENNAKLITGVSDLVDDVFIEIDKVVLTELDEAYAERLIRDVKANSFDQLEQLLINYIQIDWDF